MKIFTLITDFTPDSPPWINIFWPQYHAIAQSTPAVLLSSPHGAEEPTLADKIRERLQRPGHQDRLLRDVTEQLDSEGPNVLIVWALRSRDIDRARMLEPIWDRFSHKVLAIVDNLQPKYTLNHVRGRYDLITSFCGDLARDYEQELALPTLYFPPHTDALTFCSTSSYRPIDLFIVGRRDTRLYPPVHAHFNEPGRNRLSLDFVSRTRNTEYSSEEEFRLLISTYGKSSMAFCFAPTRLERFHSRSPLTERWVHAWASGCTVIGTIPKGTGVAEATDWPESMISLPDEPDGAIAVIEEALADKAGMERRRLRNVVEALRRHDTRHRLNELLTALDLPRPEGLNEGLQALETRAREIETHG